MLHDLNALASVSKASAPLTIVVLNNGGGAIFRFLPIAGHVDVFSPFFDTPHDYCFEQSSAGFGLPHHLVTTRETFKRAFELAQQGNGPVVIEVRTGQEETHATIETVRGLARGVALGVCNALAAAPPPITR